MCEGLDHFESLWTPGPYVPGEDGRDPLKRGGGGKKRTRFRVEGLSPGMDSMEVKEEEVSVEFQSSAVFRRFESFRGSKETPVRSK